jgi:hypothetical protein
MKKTYTTKIVDEIISHNGIMNSNELWYRNNFGFRDSNIPFDMTIEEEIEYLKCKADIIYFIENYCYIIDKNQTNQLFKLRTYQKGVINNLENNKFNCIASCRQIGISTTLYAYYLHKMIFELDFSILHIDKNLEIFKHMYFYLPFFLKPGVRSFEENRIRFFNGSYLKIGDKKNTIVGFSPKIICLNDLDWYENSTEVLASIYPVVSTRVGDSMILNSSFKSKDSFYYKLFENSIIGNWNTILLNCHNSFKPTIKWIDQKISEIGYENYHREYELFQTNLKMNRAIKLSKLSKVR